MMGHSPTVVIMESKPTSFLLELQKSMEDEENEINLTVEQWKEIKQDVKKVKDTLSRGLRGLQMLDDGISSDIAHLLSLKEDIQVIPEDSTAASLAEEMEDITASRMVVQQDFEYVRKSSLPTDDLVSVMEVLLNAFGVGNEELSRDKKKMLKRLEAAVSAGMRNDPGSGDIVGDFGVTMTFFHESGTKIGTVLIKPDVNIFHKLYLGAFNNYDDEDPFYQMLYSTKILNVRNIHFFLLPIILFN